MRSEGYDEDVLDDEGIIDDFMGENARARDLRLMCAALTERRDDMRSQLAKTTDERQRSRLKAKIAEMGGQIAVLRQEESVTQFVENSVRVTLRKSILDEEQ